MAGCKGKLSLYSFTPCAHAKRCRVVALIPLKFKVSTAIRSRVCLETWDARGAVEEGAS